MRLVLMIAFERTNYRYDYEPTLARQVTVFILNFLFELDERLQTLNQSHFPSFGFSLLLWHFAPAKRLKQTTDSSEFFH